MKKMLKTNPELVELIENLKTLGGKDKIETWKKTAKYLSRPTRKKIEVTLNKLNKETKENETIIVPGKVLATGNLKHSLTVAAFQFSESAKNKIKNTLTIKELMEKNPKAKDLKIIK